MNSEERKQRKRENTKRWRAAHPEKVREHCRKYHINHREQRLLYYKAYYRKIRDKARKYDEITGGGTEEEARNQ